jgi:hypothetical protein
MVRTVRPAERWINLIMFVAVPTNRPENEIFTSYTRAGVIWHAL